MEQIMQKVPMTVEGAKKLKEELARLKSEERPKIVKAIAEARAHGDLKENAEYHAAKELQGLTEARVRDLEHKIANAQVIDISKIPHTGKIVFGVTVKLLNIDTEQQVAYKIVGDEESDLKTNKISIHSPIARALIGKQTGDIVEIATPTATVSYEVLAVEYVS
jgi:transcription elongation factor GreA